MATVKDPGWSVEVYEVGTHEGLPYLAMEFMDKGSLALVLANSPLAPSHAARRCLVPGSARPLTYTANR